MSGGGSNEHGRAGHGEPVGRGGAAGSGEPAMPERRDAILREIKDHLAAENAQNLKALLAGMTEDCYNLVLCDPSPLYRGPREVAKRYGRLWTAFPDLQVRLRRVVAIEGEMAVTEHTLSGTHRGPLFGVAPTGRFVHVDTAVIWEFAGERVRGETVYFDLATLLRQTGTLTLSA
jgi:steroid delta-isomerase-like uncharacterized protein